MSENTPTPEELVEEVAFEVEDAQVIPMPIDPTLQNEGEAADAYATGQAIAAVFAGAKVNGVSFVNKAVVIYAGNILMSNASGAQTIAEAIAGIGDKDASQIMYDSVNLVTIADAIDGIIYDMDTEISESDIDDIFDEVFEEADE